MAKTTDIYFLTVLEAGKCKIKVLANLVSGESLLPDLQMTTFVLYPYIEEREIISRLFL